MISDNARTGIGGMTLYWPAAGGPIIGYAIPGGSDRRSNDHPNTLMDGAATLLAWIVDRSSRADF